LTLLVEKGTFVKKSGTGSQEVNLTGAFQPKVLWLWSTGSTTNATYAEHFQATYGFSDGTNDACIHFNSEDASASTDCAGALRSDSIIAFQNTATPATVTARADVTTFDTDGFTLNWAVGDATLSIIHYMAIGGTDITNVLVKHVTNPTGNGNRAETGVGFQGDFLQLLYPGFDSIGLTANTIKTDAYFMIGAATSSTARWSFGSSSEHNAATSDTYNRKEITRCLAGWSPSAGTISSTNEADFVSWGSDGFTLNWSNMLASFTGPVAYLIIKGGLWDVGNGTAPASTGTQNISITSGRDPAGVQMFTWGDTTLASGVAEAEARIVIGGGDGSLNEGCISTHDLDNQATAEITSRISSNAKILQAHTATATATSSTLLAECDLTGMSTSGQFSVNWTTTLSGMGYFWFTVSEPGAAQFNRAPATDTITVADASTTRVLSAARVTTADTITVADASTTRSKSWPRVPSTDSSTVSDSSLTRMLSVARAPSDSTTVTAGTATRLLSTSRIPSTDTITLSESITPLKTAGTAALVRPVSDKVTVGEGAYSLYVHIPLYIYPFHWVPGSEWYQLSDLMAANPDVLFICKINVNSGPDAALNTDYTTGIGILKSQGNDKHIKIIGYVFTSYGSRLMSDVKTDIDRWVSFYGSDINGIFLDEMESVAGEEAYYQEITNYIHKDKGLEISWGNPGNAIAESYVKASAVDIFQISETTDYPTSGTITSATFSGTYSPNKFAMGIHTAATYDSTKIADFLTKAAYIFVTADNGVTPNNPYDTLSTYIDDLAAQSNALPKAVRTVSFSRIPSTDSTTVSAGTTARILSAIRLPSTDSATVLDASLVRSRGLPRVPTTDTATISDFSLTRLLSATRAPSTDTITVTAGTTARMLSALRIPTTDTIASTESVIGGKVYGRIPSTDSIAIVDSTLTRLLSLTRSQSDTTAVIENLIRILSAFRVPSTDSTTVADAGVPIRIRTLTRTPTADVATVTDSSLTRLLSALRLASDTTSISESLTATKAGTLLRTVSDTTATTDGALSRSLSSVRTPSSDTVSIVDSSLVRMKSALRIPSQDTISITDSSLIRTLQLARVVSTDTIALSESVSSLLTTPGVFQRSVSDTVAIAEASLIRLLQSVRVPGTDTSAITENIVKVKTMSRVPTTDTVIVSAGTVTSSRSLLRLPTQDTANIIETSLIRLLSLARSASDTTVISELQGQILHSRALLETVSITEPLLKRVVTAIRSVQDTVDITEQLFFQTYHKYVFDTVIVAEQLFRERTVLSGPTSYAIPDEVRPLLGNLGAQRTNEQIELAIDAAYDEINTKTNRIPPNEWKDTDHNFGVIKKLTRYIAAREMAIGIKDFDTKPLDMEIEMMFKDLLQFDTTSNATQDIVGSSEGATYALNERGVIWSVRYPNLRKNSLGENDTTINPNT
jgi:hypothetical protein